VAAEVFQAGEVITYRNAELNYAYRTSRLQTDGGVVLSGCWQCTPGHDPQRLLQQTSDYLHHRRSTQPYHLPSCGSVFRNPPAAKAGWLIEQSGLKGYQIGQAQVSPMHANFIVNLGGGNGAGYLRFDPSCPSGGSQKVGDSPPPGSEIFGGVSPSLDLS